MIESRAGQIAMIENGAGQVCFGEIRFIQAVVFLALQ
jgi:hypothetical protein